MTCKFCRTDKMVLKTKMKITNRDFRMKNIKLISTFLLSIVLLSTGCAYTPKVPDYVDSMSEARNITSAGGLSFGIKDRNLSESEKPYSPGTSFGDLLAIANVAAGALDGGVLGMNNVGSAAFNAAHGVWATSDDDHWSTNYFYAYIPKSWNSFASPIEVRDYLNDLVVKESLETLDSLDIRYEDINGSESRNGKPVQRWALESSTYGCDIDRKNCVLTIYTVTEKEVTEAMSPAFLGDGVSKESWKFWRGPIEAKNTIDITAVGTKEILPEVKFYEGLSHRMPNWFNLYVAPARASSEDFENGFVPYNFVMKQGEMLKFIDPKSL